MSILENDNNLQFTQKQYEYFVKNCGFTLFELDVLNDRRIGKRIKEISNERCCSIATINRTIKNIKKKIIRIL